MFRRKDDLLASVRETTEATAKMFAILEDSNLDTAVADGYRSVRDLAWHIVTSIPEMMNRTGLGISAVDPHSMPPASASEIKDGYSQAAAELLAELEKSWTDETLEQLDDMYGMQWPRGKTAMILVSHEIHHRGQLSVLLRQAGALVPGLMGPSKEEWSSYGMEAPPY